MQNCTATDEQEQGKQVYWLFVTSPSYYLIPPSPHLYSSPNYLNYFLFPLLFPSLRIPQEVPGISVLIWSSFASHIHRQHPSPPSPSRFYRSFSVELSWCVSHLDWIVWDSPGRSWCSASIWHSFCWNFHLRFSLILHPCPLGLWGWWFSCAGPILARARYCLVFPICHCLFGFMCWCADKLLSHNLKM